MFSGENKNVISSFVSLGVIQATNYILPLLTIPYLVKVLGPDKYGVVAVAQAFTYYLIILTEYGFNISATREVSINRHDRNRVSEVYSSVMVTKTLLCGLSFLILVGLVFFVPQFNKEREVYLFSFGSVIGQVLLPVWLFQGLERMKYLTYFNLFSKLLCTLLIFIMIDSPSSYVYVPIYYAMGNIMAGLAALIIIKYVLKIHFTFPLMGLISTQLKEGWYIFISNFSINSYNNSNIFILNLFASPTIVGYYSVAEKVIMAMRQLIGAFAIATYPHVCNLTSRTHREIKLFFKSVFTPFAFVVFLLCGCVFTFSDEIIKFISGMYIAEASLLLRILSFVPFIVVLDNPFYQVLLAYNEKKSYVKVSLAAALINVCFNILLVINFGAVGTCISIIITETFVTVALLATLELKYSKYSLLS